MRKNKAVFLYDRSTIMAKPWLDAGWECWCFDGQHPEGVTTDGKLNLVGCMFNAHRKLEDTLKIAKIVGTGVGHVFGFPECTDLTVTGALHFEKKKSENALFQHEAIELADLVRCVGVFYRCPWAFENPRSVISTHYRKPDFSFNPCDYGGYLPENDSHPDYPEIYPPRDAYNKDTWIWSGQGYKEPKRQRIEPAEKENPGWKKLGGKSLRTKNIRSATPRGFAKANFLANGSQL